MYDDLTTQEIDLLTPILTEDQILRDSKIDVIEAESTRELALDDNWLNNGGEVGLRLSELLPGGWQDRAFAQGALFSDANLSVYAVAKIDLTRLKLLAFADKQRSKDAKHLKLMGFSLDQLSLFLPWIFDAMQKMKGSDALLSAPGEQQLFAGMLAKALRRETIK